MVSLSFCRFFMVRVVDGPYWLPINLSAVLAAIESSESTRLRN